jgi:hypothetical protein
MKFASVVLALCFTCYFAESKDIVKLAEELGATTLVSYLKVAGLEDALKGTGKSTFDNFRFVVFLFVIQPIDNHKIRSLK